MKRISLLLFALPLILISCKTECVEDAGMRVSHVNTVDSFDEVEVQGTIKVVFHQDSSYAIKVEADSNVIDEVKASVSRGALKLSLDPEKYCGADSVVVYAGVGNLKSIKAGANSSLASQGRLNLGDLKLTLNGNTTTDLDLNASKLTTEVDGTADIKLIGQAGIINVKSKGSLNLNAFDFVVGQYNLDMEGVSKCNINVLNELKVETSGSSEVFYKGSPKKIDKKKTGNARLQKVN
ncbi:head GIN domain-containing protein [Pedobacter sp.]|uniref:head GIN domain-containing protein n=1 Tax=Pedobacter sp. TaxID=1411316 RepID=UPI003D7F5754